MNRKRGFGPVSFPNMAEYEHKQPIPERCDVCENPHIYFGDNSVIYNTNRGTWHKCYYCSQCRASVSCHLGTNIPKGLMATAAQRRYRTKAHEAFDPIWQGGLMTRDEAYQWIAQLFEISADNAHIGLLSREQLEILIAKAPVFYKTAIRRKEKQHAKSVERFSREQQAANRGRNGKRH